MSTPPDLDVLVPARDRPGALAVTPAGLAAQTSDTASDTASGTVIGSETGTRRGAR
ncbi:hypothetical protein [Microbispora sp. NBC_01389]|uniref:hypothetical protein n=1 Tax=Microbispora sp. NBC_01389 TaxID=2903584 RepID=UPI003245C3A5